MKQSRYGFWHAVALGCLIGVLVFLQSNLLSWMIPGSLHRSPQAPGP